jgi:hypothetical protein
MKALANASRSPSPAQVLLLALVALLVFGSCGGGVQGFLNSQGERRRARLRAILVQERVDVATARQRLHGRARREAVRRSKALSAARLDSLLPGTFAQQKLRRRYSKIKRQVLRDPPPLAPAAPAPRP